MLLCPTQVGWPALLVMLLSAATIEGAPAGVAPLSELPQDLQRLQQQSSVPVASRAVVSTVSSVSAITTTTTSAATTRSPNSSSQSSKLDNGALEGSASSTFHLLDEFMDYSGSGQNITEAGGGSSYRLGYTVDTGGSVRKFRYEERTPEGAIVGEFGFHKNDGVIRGVRYSAEPGVHPKVLYEALVKFFTL
ncbi:uncharacterized protein LOC144099378 [Amblyomma americanum]